MEAGSNAQQAAASLQAEMSAPALDVAAIGTERELQRLIGRHSWLLVRSAIDENGDLEHET
jgi:hypothetical protein